MKLLLENEIQVAIGMPAGQAYVSFILTYLKVLYDLHE